jgi:hypothetical protein
MGYPVAYLSGNTTTYETGMFKRGTIGQNQAAALTGSYRWWNGIDVTSSQYLIYSDTFTTSASTAANATPAAWATPDLADQSLLNLINTLPERIGKLPFTYLPVALQWLQSTGRYFLLKNGYENIVTNGMALNLDAGWYLSYSGTGTTWKDLTSNGNNPLLVNGPTFDTNNGGSLLFDGSNDYANIASPTNLNLGTSDFTISVWFYLYGLPSGESYPNCYWVFGTGPQSSISNTQIFVGKDRLHFDINTDNGGPIDINHGFSINTWYHIVVTRSGNTFTAYKNGVVLQTATSSQSAVNGYGWAIGKPEPTPSGTIGYFYGRIATFSVQTTALSQTEILQNYNAQKTRFGLTADTIVTSGLTLNLDAGSVISYPTTGTTWYDITGNNYNVTLNNGPTFSNSGTSSSIVFDGTDDYGIIPYNSAWNYNNNITLEAWVMVTSNTNWYQGIFGPFSQTPAYNGFNFSVNAFTNKFAFLVGGNGGAAYYVQQNTQYSLNTWYHLVGVINNGTSRLYVNGILQNDSTSMTVAPPVGPFMLGKFYDGINDFYFGGRIANGKFYNRVLSQSEITQNYNALKGRYGL